MTMGGVLTSYALIGLLVARVYSQDMSCDHEEYRASGVGRCGARLANVIFKHCNGTPYTAKKRGAKLEKGLDIFQSEDQANTFLAPKKREIYYDDYYPDYEDQQMTSGVVCECCVHHCTQREMDGYCATDDQNTRRRRRSVQATNTLLPEDIQKQISQASTLLELSKAPFVQALDRQKYINMLRAKNSNQASSKRQDIAVKGTSEVEDRPGLQQQGRRKGDGGGEIKVYRKVDEKNFLSKLLTYLLKESKD